MAVRQYIGARYVPKFMGNYEPTQVYEALSVVDNGMGTSYISKIPTPANTPLTDTDHWAIYGASSGAIVNLQNQIDTINNTTIPPIADDVSLLKNKKYIFVSDSYGARIYGGKTLIENIADMAGIDPASYGNVQQNGSGFIGLVNVDPFLTLMQNATFTFPDNEVTDIIVMGGANDITESQPVVEQAISIFCNYCKTRFPNAKIRLAHTGHFWDKTRLSLLINVSLPAWRNCGAYGATYIKNSEYILHKKSLVESDGVHPASTGVFEIAKQIASALFTNTCDVHYRTSASIDVQNGALFNNVTKPGSTPITISVDNEITSVIFGSEQRIVAQMASQQTFSTDITISDIATINQTDPCMVFGLIDGGTTQGVPITASPLANPPVPCAPGCMYIGSTDNITFNIQNRFIPGYSTNSYAGTQIYIAGQSFNVPSELC